METLPKPIPQKLYKYRPFNAYTVGLLCRAEQYYANPFDFNDPLDCKPSVRADLAIRDLEGLLDVCFGSKEAWNKLKHTLRGNASEYGPLATHAEAQRHYRIDLIALIKAQLYAAFKDYGVVSLNTRWSCPLMWSHYGDQHRGLCLEYTTDRNLEHANLRPIDYKGSRVLKLSDMVLWKRDQDRDAYERIFKSFFTHKASDWEYEDEWRLISETQGSHASPITLTGVYFGMRCDYNVKTAVVRLLSDMTDGFGFQEIYDPLGNFQLLSRTVETDEVIATGVSHVYADIFDDVEMPGDA